MDNIRVFLWLTLLGMAWLTYTAWVADYGPRPTPVSPGAPGVEQSAAPPGQLPDVPGGTSTPAPAQPTPTVQAAPPAELIRVRTDVLDVRINSQGGDLVRAELTQYPVNKDMPEPVVRLLDDLGTEKWVFESGLRSAQSSADFSHREQRLFAGARPGRARRHARLGRRRSH
jgi:YidC/Oxa1 family membrane protein insertase